MRQTLYIFLCLSLFASLTEISFAHDLRGLVAEQSSLEPETRAKFEEVKELRRLLAARTAASHDPRLEAVVQTALKWPGGKATGCFFDGGMEAREHVVQIATRWTASTSLQFDFGEIGNRRICDPNHPSDIRVSFRGAGYWSYVGTQSRLINPYKQTLNLEGMDKGSWSKEDDGVILHEFGHAIGFEHEHQSPVGGCDKEFNWSYLYTSLGWSKDQIDRNMRQLNVSSSTSGLLTTTFDRKSIMLYSLSPDAFNDPTHANCFIPTANTELSSVDRSAAATVYPSLPSPSPGEQLSPPTSPDAIIAAQQLNRLMELIGDK